MWLSRLQKIALPHAHPSVHAALTSLHDAIRIHATFVAESAAEKDPEVVELYKQETQRSASTVAHAESVALLAVREGYEKATKCALATERNCILEIRPGSGGQEAMAFADELWDMYENFVTSRNWIFSCVTLSDSVRVANVTGHAAFRQLMHENGVHRVQRIPSNDAKGRIQTSSASVVVLPEAGATDLPPIPDRELRYDVKKSTGPGGSSMNACHSAIRLTHLPTGLNVNVTQSSSQSDNKKIGLNLLRSRLWERERAKKDQATMMDRKSAIGTGDRSEKIRTYNFLRDEMIDHRINHAPLGAREILYESSFEVLCDTLAQEIYETTMTSDAISWAGG